MSGRATSKPRWRTYRFDEIATNVNDRVDDPSEADVEYYVGLEHLDSDSLTIRRWGSPTDVQATKLRFREGDIIFGRRRVYQRKLGVAQFDGICSAHAMVLRAKPNVALPEFLPFFMQSDLFMERAKEISVGSLSPTINWPALAREEFAMPPLDEQRRLATLMMSVDSAHSALADAAASLESLVVSCRAERFDPALYAPVPLASLCGDGDGIQIGPFGSQLHQADYKEDGVPVVMPVNMQGDRVVADGIARVSERKARLLSHHRLEAGDILLPRRGELDRRALATEENIGWLCGTGSVRVRLQSGVLPLAVLQALASKHCVKWLEANAVGTTMPNLNSRLVGAIPIPLPPKDVLADTLRVLAALSDRADSIRGRLADLAQIRRGVLKTALAG